MSLCKQVTQQPAPRFHVQVFDCGTPMSAFGHRPCSETHCLGRRARGGVSVAATQFSAVESYAWAAAAGDAAGARSAAAAGRYNETVVPSPGVLWNETAPPLCCTKPKTVDKPSPEAL